MIRILIADDHSIIRDRIRQILRDETDMEISFEAISGKEALEITGRETFDLILLDFYLPDLNALQIIPRIKKLRRDLPVIILSSLNGELYIRKAMEAGASAFIAKDQAFELLAGTIRKVVAKKG
jgi:DNA-binding NarL/FixJ family response regulator